MISCYCKVCGLYITIPNEYAGGSGVCPRCRTRLRIPVPVKPENPKYKTQLRYIASLAAEPYDREILPNLCDHSFGHSALYRCTQCQEFYESITIAPQTPNQCPSCKTENQPAVPNVKFSRNYADEGDAKRTPSCKLEDYLDIPYAMPAEDCTDEDDEDIPYAIPVLNSSLGEFNRRKSTC